MVASSRVFLAGLGFRVLMAQFPHEMKACTAAVEAHRGLRIRWDAGGRRKCYKPFEKRKNFTAMHEGVFGCSRQGACR